MRYGANDNFIRENVSSEKYSRGRRGAPAKGIGRVTGARVRIPLSPFQIFKNEIVIFLKKVVDKHEKLWYTIEVVAQDNNRQNLDSWTMEWPWKILKKSSWPKYGAGSSAKGRKTFKRTGILRCNLKTVSQIYHLSMAGRKRTYYESLILAQDERWRRA